MRFLSYAAMPLASALAFAAALTVGSMTMAPPAEASGGVAPFCISTGGGGEGGGYRVGRCDFFDYQQCLQAAAGGGNCVQNIDFHGDASQAPAVTRPHRRR